MLGLTSLKVYNSPFNITKENNKFEIYTDPVDSEFSFTEVKDKVAEVLGLSDISTEVLEHEIYGQKINKTNRKLSTEESQTDGFYIYLSNYIHLSFRGFERYLRFSSPLDENDIPLILKRYNSQFIEYKIPPCASTFEDLSEVLSRGFKNEFEIRGSRPNQKLDESDSIITKMITLL